MNLDHLAQLATEATPGPWTSRGFRVTVPIPDFHDIHGNEIPGGLVTFAVATDARNIAGPGPRSEHDAAFIAAANPSVVLALVEVCRAAQEVTRAIKEYAVVNKLHAALAKLDNLGRGPSDPTEAP